MPNNASIEKIREEFIEKVGLICQADGLPRIAGRVLGLLIFDAETISFGDLAERLQVSRGSISSSVRLLSDHQLIKKISKPGERQDYFRLADNPYVSLLDMVTQRIANAEKEITASIADIPENAPAIRKRLEEYARFYEVMNHGLTDALARLETDKHETK